MGEPVRGRGPVCWTSHPLAFPSGSWATFPMRGKVPYNKASLLAVAIKGDPRCYNCGKPGHLRKDCLATLKRGKGNDKLPPGDCPRCGKGRHWAKECRSKFDKNGQPIKGNF